MVSAVFSFFPAPPRAGGKTTLSDTSRAVILTFDDGPRPKFEPRLLDFLKEEKIHAAFFVQGWQAEANPGLVRRIVAEGHELGNHTYGHGRLDVYAKKKGKQWVLDDIERASRAIAAGTGRRPIFFRPPYWVIGEKDKTARMPDENAKQRLCKEFASPLVTKEELMCMGYIVQVLDDPALSPELRMLRDVNTTDYEFHEWYKKDPEAAKTALVRAVRIMIRSRERRGIGMHILVFHELPVSLAALRILVPEWRREGYAFRTLREVHGK